MVLLHLWSLGCFFLKQNTLNIEVMGKVFFFHQNNISIVLWIDIFNNNKKRSNVSIFQILEKMIK